MKSLIYPRDKEQILQRLRLVQPTSHRHWGKMSAHQMVCHLRDSFRFSVGEVVVAMAPGSPQRVIKWIALNVPLSWPKGTPTPPEVDQEIGGIKPVAFETDMKELCSAFERFIRLPQECERPAHPFFGQLTYKEWMRWGYLHTDHHLRQFGV